VERRRIIRLSSICCSKGALTKIGIIGLAAAIRIVQLNCFSADAHPAPLAYDTTANSILPTTF
jgi:hypothetical protein